MHTHTHIHIQCSEVFSIPEIHEELVWTVKQFCHEHVVIYSIFINRPFSFMFFGHLAGST